jgi:hypothetical protein
MKPHILSAKIIICKPENKEATLNNIYGWKYIIN